MHVTCALLGGLEASEAAGGEPVLLGSGHIECSGRDHCWPGHQARRRSTPLASRDHGHHVHRRARMDRLRGSSLHKDMGVPTLGNHVHILVRHGQRVTTTKIQAAVSEIGWRRVERVHSLNEKFTTSVTHVMGGNVVSYVPNLGSLL